VSRYRRYVTVTKAQQAALPVAIGARSLTMSIWTLAVGRMELGQTQQDGYAATRQAQKIASCAGRAFIDE